RRYRHVVFFPRGRLASVMKQYPYNLALVQYIRRHGVNRRRGWSARTSSISIRYLYRRRLFFAVGFLGAVDPEFVELCDEQAFFNVKEGTAFTYEYRRFDGIRNQSNALHHVVDNAGTFNRVVACIAQQHLGLIENEILLMFGDILPERRRSELLYIRVGVITVGKKQHLYVEPLFQQHIRSSERCLDAGLVAVIKDGYVFGIPRNQPYLPAGK